jgi:hypothetical protein
MTPRLVNQREHALKISIDVVIPEAQHPETLVSKVPVALDIPPSMLIEVVLTTIDLDDETVLEADEIDNVTVKR